MADTTTVMQTNIFRLESCSSLYWKKFGPANVDNVPHNKQRLDYYLITMVEFQEMLQDRGKTSIAYSMAFSEKKGDTVPIVWLFHQAESVLPELDLEEMKVQLLDEGEYEFSSNNAQMSGLITRAYLTRAEKELEQFGYRSFGDFMVKCVHTDTGVSIFPLSSELPALELNFSLSEFGLSVEAHASNRKFRKLSELDFQEDFPRIDVIVSPDGSRGSLVGKVSSNLVKLMEKKTESFDERFKCNEENRSNNLPEFVEIKLFETSSGHKPYPNVIFPIENVLVPDAGSADTRPLPSAAEKTKEREFPGVNYLSLGWVAGWRQKSRKLRRERGAKRKLRESLQKTEPGKVPPVQSAPANSHKNGSQEVHTVPKVAKPEMQSEAAVNAEEVQGVEMEERKEECLQLCFEYEGRDVANTLDECEDDMEDSFFDSLSETAGQPPTGTECEEKAELSKKLKSEQVTYHRLWERLRYSHRDARRSQSELASRAEALMMWEPSGRLRVDFVKAREKLQRAVKKRIRDYVPLSKKIEKKQPHAGTNWAAMAAKELSKETSTEASRDREANGKEVSAAASASGPFLDVCPSVLGTSKERLRWRLAVDMAESRKLQQGRATLCRCRGGWKQAGRKTAEEQTDKRRLQIPSRISGHKEEASRKLPEVPVGVWTSIEVLAGSAQVPKPETSLSVKQQQEAEASHALRLRSALLFGQQVLSPLTPDPTLEALLALFDQGRCPRCGFFQPGANSAPAWQAVRPLASDSLSASAVSSILHTEVGPALQQAFPGALLRGPLALPLPPSSLPPDHKPPEAPTQDSALCPLDCPSVLVGYQEDWLRTSPSILRLWEKMPLQPFADRKPVHYFVLCPDAPGTIQEASSLLLELSSMYESCLLGSHTAGTVPSPPKAGSLPAGFIPVPLGPPASSPWDPYMSALHSLSATIQGMASQRDKWRRSLHDGDPSYVVYIVPPAPAPSLPSLAALLCQLSASWMQWSAPAFHVQLLPNPSVGGSPELEVGPSVGPTLVRSLALGLFSKLRRTNLDLASGQGGLPKAQPGRQAPAGFKRRREGENGTEGGTQPRARVPGDQDWYSLYEPAFVLGEMGSSAVNKGQQQGQTEADPERAAVHCCYTWLATETAPEQAPEGLRRDLVCAWSDSRGELLDFQVVPTGSGLAPAFRELLKRGAQFARLAGRRAGKRQKVEREIGFGAPVVVLRVGQIPSLELQAWQAATSALSLADWFVQGGLGGPLAGLDSPVLVPCEESAAMAASSGCGVYLGWLEAGSSLQLVSEQAEGSGLYVPGTPAGGTGSPSVSTPTSDTPRWTQSQRSAFSPGTSGPETAFSKWGASLGSAILYLPEDVPFPAPEKGGGAGLPAVRSAAVGQLLVPPEPLMDSDSAITGASVSQGGQGTVLSLGLVSHFVPKGQFADARTSLQWVAADVHGLCCLANGPLPLHAKMAVRMRGLLGLGLAQDLGDR